MLYRYEWKSCISTSSLVDAASFDMYQPTRSAVCTSKSSAASTRS
jgi:hypothetical protein